MYRKITKFIILTINLALTAITIMSCEETSSKVEEFNIEKSDYKDWDRLLNVESVIQLQETDCNLMSYARKCIVTDSNIFFWDYKAKCIYSFSTDGKFICQIGRLGHSGSEYAELWDICMGEKDSTIMVLDGRGVLCYNPKDGRFVERKKFSSPNFGEYEIIAPVGASDFLCYTDSRNSNSIVLDSPKGWEGLRKSKRYHFGVNYFYRYKNSYRVISDYGDFYIDNYEDGKLKTLYKFNLGEDALPDDILPKTFEEFNVVDKSPKYFKCITDACETSKWLCLRLVGPKQEYYSAFINKDNKTYAFGKSSQSLGLGIIDAKGEHFYALIYPEFVPPKSFGKRILEKYNIPSQKNSPVVVKLKLNEKAL